MLAVRYLIAVFLLFLAVPLHSARIKDVATLAGVRENQLVGYGLVVGLDGTGDKTNQAPFTSQSFENMLFQFGIHMPANSSNSSQLKNVAAVAVSATLPPFAKRGQKLDVNVSSIGNATSLRGGSLLMTPLKGADGKVYSIAQGSVIVSGFGAKGEDGSKVTVNSTSSGSIPNGASVEDTVEMPFVNNGTITFELSQADFTTAERIAVAVNQEFGRKIARALDAGSVSIKVGSLIGENDERGYSRYVPVISRIENIQFRPAEVSARVIVNSRTGTIVIGQNVTIAPVAVAHGNLSVVVSEKKFVSQPNALAAGKTVVQSASEINIAQQPSRAFVFSPGASLNDLVTAINLVGAAPGDIISILEAIKAAGALNADLDVI